jgi:hypothetical protein
VHGPSRCRSISIADPVCGRVLRHVNGGRSSLNQLAARSRDKHSRGRVLHSARDSTPAAIHSPKDRIAIEGHMRDVPAKRHTELRAAAVAVDRNHVEGHSRLAAHKREADRSLAAGRIRQTGDSRVTGCSRAAHTCRAARRREVVGRLHPRLRHDIERLPRRTALRSRQSQRRGGA